MIPLSTGLFQSATSAQHNDMGCGISAGKRGRTDGSTTVGEKYDNGITGRVSYAALTYNVIHSPLLPSRHLPCL